MKGSLYTAVQGVSGQQTKMNVIANNMANINTAAFKTKNAVFSELIRKNLYSEVDIQDPPDSGSGAAVQEVGSDFTPASYKSTGNMNDYAIVGKGFFMLQDPESGGISFTRDGTFISSLRGEEFYLATVDGKLVMDKEGQAIRIEEGKTPDIGIFEFSIESGLINIGKNEYEGTVLSGIPVLTNFSRLEQGAIEVSGVDLAMEMTKAMEDQKAYAMALKMVQTSDEITDTINSLR